MREDAGKQADLVLGFDPGVHLGWCALRMGGGAPVHVASGVVAVDLAAGDPGLATLRAELGALLSRFAPVLVAVERIQRVHPCPRLGPSYASGLVLAAHVAGEVAGFAAARDVEVRTGTREAARAALGLAPAAKDAAVAVEVRARVAGWPPRSNEHERDAAAVALLAGVPAWAAAA
jgi:crossover junction endodeoxyribonuclease RuvC